MLKKKYFMLMTVDSYMYIIMWYSLLLLLYIYYIFDLLMHYINQWMTLLKHLSCRDLSVLLRFTVSDYPFGTLDLRLLITPLVS